jgi:hypothetical protein
MASIDKIFSDENEAGNFSVSELLIIPEAVTETNSDIIVCPVNPDEALEPLIKEIAIENGDNISVDTQNQYYNLVTTLFDSGGGSKTYIGGECKDEKDRKLAKKIFLLFSNLLYALILSLINFLKQYSRLLQNINTEGPHYLDINYIKTFGHILGIINTCGKTRTIRIVSSILQNWKIICKKFFYVLKNIKIQNINITKDTFYQCINKIIGSRDYIERNSSGEVERLNETKVMKDVGIIRNKTYTADTQDFIMDLLGWFLNFICDIIYEIENLEQNTNAASNTNLRPQLPRSRLGGRITKKKRKRIGKRKYKKTKRFFKYK